jgi:hypothetical protein
MTAMLQLVIAAVVMCVVWQLVATTVAASAPTSDASVQTTASGVHDNDSQQTMSPHELQLRQMDEVALLRSASEREPAATADAAVQTDVQSRAGRLWRPPIWVHGRDETCWRVADVPTTDVAVQTVVANAEATVPTAEVIEAPPLPAAAALIWFTFAFSKATLQFVKARGARWCNVRCGWYMYSTISTPIQIEEVLQRCERTATPGRDRNPWEVRSSRSRFATCTRPCLSCSPMYMATLITCIVPAEATATAAYWQHLGGLTPMMRFLYGVLVRRKNLRFFSRKNLRNDAISQEKIFDFSFLPPPPGLPNLVPTSRRFLWRLCLLARSFVSPSPFVIQQQTQILRSVPLA